MNLNRLPHYFGHNCKCYVHNTLKNNKYNNSQRYIKIFFLTNISKIFYLINKKYCGFIFS